jgi:hypothetical protein
VVEGVAYNETTLEAPVMDVVVQYFDGCPNWELARDRLGTILDKEKATIRFERIDTIEKADASGFRGSPTILLDGVDPFAEPNAPVGLACRVYSTDEGHEGAPSVAQLQAALDSVAMEVPAW